MNLDRILSWAALALAVAALAWTLDTALSGPRRRDLLDRKAGAVRELVRLSGEDAPDRAWLEDLDADGLHAPPPLERLAAGRFPGGSANVSPRSAVPVADGWQRRATLLTLSGISFADIPAFCGEAARQRPPWRLREAEFLPSADHPGTGDARLLFEALEKP